jgi:hypothetical protein
VSTNIKSFAEESCWDGEQFRSIRRPVIFVVELWYPQLLNNHEFTADFGVFFDPHDEWLIDILKREIPGPPWDWYVYWKKPDHSSINLLNPETNADLGSIRPRGALNPEISGERLPEGIVSLAAWRENRERTGQKGDCPESC